MCYVRNLGKTMIFTTDSMDECKELCTHMGIIMNGELQCLGKTHYLEEKFAKGILLTVKILAASNDDE